MDVFTENHLVAAAHLGAIRNAKRAWGVALVRTDLTNGELEFLARSFRGCVEQEKKAKANVRDHAMFLRALNRRGR